MRGIQTIQGSIRALLSASLLSVVATTGWSQSLTWLGTLPNGDDSRAYSISADGSVVVGMSTSPYGGRAFRWTAATGMIDILDTQGGRYSEARGVSADGSVVVGIFHTTEGNIMTRAFRWTAATGLTDLGTLGGPFSEAHGVSDDGSVVVGWAHTPYVALAVRWTPSGTEVLGTLGGDTSRAYGVSADGSVVVGTAQNHRGISRAFRWTEPGIMQDLGNPDTAWSYAHGVSADGSVVVGYYWDGRYRAFRWTESGGMQDLGSGEAYGVSADGSVVVGASGHAFRWTTAGGLEDLNTTYARLLTNGSYLARAEAVSPDGRYIVGQGRNIATARWEAFLLDTRRVAGDVDGNGCVDDADLLAVLFAFGQTGDLTEDVNDDRVVDDADLLMVLFNFGSGC